MNHKQHVRRALPALRSSLWAEDRGAQLVEFAVALPLLVLFIVGIFDFSGAFTLKQKLTNIARDAARVAASDPSNDLASTFASGTAPASVVDAYNLVHNDLAANQINDCGMRATSVTSAGTLTWQYKVTPSAGAPCGIILTINRGYVFPSTSTTPPSSTCTSQTVGITQTAVVATCVSIQYNYAWKFGGVSKILGANTSLPAQIAGVAVATNEN
jgi:Flp pilus assembly protein TadG